MQNYDEFQPINSKRQIQEINPAFPYFYRSEYFNRIYTYVVTLLRFRLYLDPPLHTELPVIVTRLIPQGVYFVIIN
jgi:hypothetical protein